MRHAQRSGAVSLPTGWLAAGLLISLGAVVVLILGNGSEVYTVLGFPDPGVVTKVGTYVTRFVLDIAAAVCAGALVYAAFFTTSTPSAGLSADGWAALRLGGWAAWVWFGSSLVIIPFAAGDSTGNTVLEMLNPVELMGAFSALYGPKAWLISAGLALIVALSSQVVLRWRATVGLVAVAVAGLLPPLAVGNVSAGLAHDLAMNTLVYHVIAAAVWLGVLAALVLHLRRGTGYPELALRRYRPFALGCWLVLAVSGVYVGLLLVGPANLFTTHYGRMLLVKVVALLFLGTIGVLMRRTLTRMATARSPAIRLVSVEIVLMLLTVAVTMGMTQRPPPSWFARLDTVEIAIGYTLPGPAAPVNLLTVWRIDILLGIAALAAAATYLLGVRRLRRRGQSWPLGRATAWLGGCLLVFVATSSGLGAYTPVSFSAHMTSHMVLNMLGPLLLVLGAPVTLALRALPAAPAGGAPGPHEWLAALTTSRLARTLSHPGLAAALFVASYYLLYLTPLFEAALSEHWSRMVLNLVTVAIGYQFYWIVIGIDTSPREFPHLGRLGMIFAVMPFHAVFAVILMSIQTPIAGLYFRTLDLPWAVDLLANQRLGGLVSLIAGELALVAAQVVLLIQWYRYDRFDGFRSGPIDRHDEEEAAYRDMLDKLKQSRGG